MGIMSGKSNTDAIERHDGIAKANDAANGSEKAINPVDPTIQDRKSVV